MRANKIIAILTAFSILFTVIALPVAADTSSQVTTIGSTWQRPTTKSYVLWDTFEDGDVSEWYFRNGEQASAQSAGIIEENNNKFLRFSITNAEKLTNNDSNNKEPLLSRSFAKNGAVQIDMDNYSVIEFDFRVSDISKPREAILINYPYPGEVDANGNSLNYSNNALGERGWYTRILFSMFEDGYFRFFAKSYVNSNAADVRVQGNPTSITTRTLSEDTWYSTKYIYDNQNKKMSVYVYDSDGYLILKSENQDMIAWWFTHYDHNKTVPLDKYEIYDITLRHIIEAVDGVWKKHSADFDIDNFKIYNQKAQLNAQVINNTDVGIIYKPQELSLAFDAPVNYTEGGITVVDSLGNPVAQSGGVYNPKNLTYTASFSNVLPEGEYKFIIGDTVTPLNNASNKIAQMDFASREVSFKTYDSMPPIASDVEIEGRVIPGQQIIADYAFSSETETEGVSIYEWYVSDTADGEFTKIEDESFKELDITDAIYGKYIKFVVTPVSNTGLVGLAKESNVISPEKAPVAENLRLSTTTLFIDSYISASYDYVDENGDEESGTEIIWYTSDSDSVDGEWAEVYRGVNYLITGADDGKYIKCSVIPQNNAVCESIGTEYFSSIVGPVADLIAATNLITENAGFELGDLTGYEIKTSTGWAGVEITDKETRTGNYALHFNPRISVQDSWGAMVPVTYGNIYLFACYAKKTSPKMQDIVGFRPYIWSGTKEFDTEAQMMVTLNDRWQLVPGTFRATSTGTYIAGHTSFHSLTTCDAYIDDMYFGELLVADIEVYESVPTEVPESGETVIPITSGKVLNQVGTQHGLWNEKIEIVIPQLQGVSVNGNNIIIDETAVTGSFVAELRCVPSYEGADQTVFSKFVDIEIIAGSNVAPKAYNVTASGTVAAGNTVSGSYDFYQVEGKGNASTVKWMYSDDPDGTYYDIPGATSADYVVDTAYADKYLKFAVTPITTDGLVGAEIVSGYVTKARAPFADNVTVSGSFNIGETITADYDYHDDNADAEGTSLYKWYVSDTQNGIYTLLEGESSEILTFTEMHKDKYFKFSVTPVSLAEPSVGAEAFSEVFRGPVGPVAENVKITRSNSRLVGSYDFYHEHEAKENGSKYEWIIDGTVVSNKIDYTINFVGVKTITFSVTPKANSNPDTGAKISVSATVEGITGNAGSNAVVGGVVSGGGFGGGGGGSSSVGGGGNSSGSFTSGVTSVNDMQLSSPEEKKQENTEPVSDLDGHWGREYIEEMVSRGVMSADENGNHNPDTLVERKDMLTYLFKTLGLEVSEYEGIFEDVEDGEFACMLQTMVDNGTIAIDTNFRPGDNISREEMCKILYISLDNAGKFEKTDEMLIEMFEDFADISQWAREYVNGVYTNKIMIGVSDTRFAPQENLTKAQAATLLTRIIKLIEGEE